MRLDKIIKSDVTCRIVNIRYDGENPMSKIQLEVRTDALRCFQGAYALLTPAEAERLVMKLNAQITRLNEQISANRLERGSNE